MLKLNFVLTLCYYSIHHVASFLISVNTAGAHAILSVGSDTSAIVMQESENLCENGVRNKGLCIFCLCVLTMYINNIPAVQICI
jgi:hypothetical protein